MSKAAATAGAATATVLDFNSAKSAGRDLEQTNLALVQRVDSSVAIRTKADCQQAVLDRQAIGEAIKRVEAFFAPLKKMAYDLHKAICNRENEVLAPLKRVDNAKRIAVQDFVAEQERLTRERERAAAEEERKRQEAAAAAEAALLEQAGEHEMAASVIEEALAAPAPVVVLPSVAAEVEGLKTVRRWAWRFAGGPKEVEKTPAAIVARSMELIPREFLGVDTKKVGAYVRAMKDSGRIPGIEIYYVDDPVR